MDKNQKTAMAFRVRSAPTLLLFNGGAVEATHVGMASKAQLAKLIDAALWTSLADRPSHRDRRRTAGSGRNALALDSVVVTSYLSNKR